MAKRDLLEEISLEISNIIGLHFPANRYSDLERGLIATAKDIGIDCSIESIYNWLLSSNLTPSDINILSGNLTIGETYFFREKPALELFTRVIIPEIIKKRSNDLRYINIWSAGCSSGEEPYTLAILLKENFPELKDWKISILASDISPKAIQKAITGIYGEWSFRDTDSALRKKYFSKTETGWSINQEIKNMVNYTYLNLAGKSYPSELTNTLDCDVIFCRNVMMYFTPKVIHEVSTRFYNSLVDQGWFITSQVELNDQYFSAFKRISFEGGVFYKKSTTDNLTQDYDIKKTTKRFSEPYIPTKTPRENPAITHKNKVIIKNKVAKYAVNIPIPDDINREFDYNEAKRLANIGNAYEAIKILEGAISSGVINSDIYYLYGSVLLENNDIANSKKALEKAIYLDSKSIMPHILLGNILKKEGKRVAALKHFNNALELTSCYNDDFFMDNSLQMTIGRIIEMIEKQIINNINPIDG